MRRHSVRPIRRLLVVGCGSGAEAAVLATEFGAAAMGIDLQGTFDPAAARIAQLRQGDATRLEFAARSFDLVYSYHVLEHVGAFTRALREMSRVLSDGGLCCIGVPNRLRLVGYLGSRDATARQKLAWNFADWSARVRGRFRNEFGAHAGFSSGELRVALDRVFASSEEITRGYYLGMYQEQARLVVWLERSGLGRFLFPAVYFLARK